MFSYLELILCHFTLKVRTSSSIISLTPPPQLLCHIFYICAIEWMFVCSQNSRQTPNTQCHGIWREWDFVKWLCHVGGALINGISAIIKEVPESSSTPPRPGHVGHQEVGPHQTQNLQAPWPWMFSLQNCEKIHLCCLIQSVYGILLDQPQRTKTLRTHYKHHRTILQFLL